jgi:hypothetical protein
LHAFTSAAVLEELDKAPEPKRSLMIGLIQDCAIIVLEVERSAYELADTYICTPMEVIDNEE